jgi:diguanylate cyclase (GGDEF)-like protein
MLLLIPLAVAVIAGAVLFSSETQRKTANVNFVEAQTAERMLSSFSLQARGLDEELFTREDNALDNYYAGKRSTAGALRTAAEASGDDPREIAAISAQRLAWRRWQAIADREIVRTDRGAPISTAALKRLAALIDRFSAANRTYQARLAVKQDEESAHAALVPLWLILGLSALFAGVGAMLFVRDRSARRHRVAAERSELAAELAFTVSQTRFGEAMQVAEHQAEAHRLLKTHLERYIPGSATLVLNRNNSADRLESTTALPADHVLAEPLAQADPRTCLAVRLSRRFDRGEASDEVLECGICGRLSDDSVCEPLLVGGEVIGSVLVSARQGLDGTALRRVDSSVTQAAPVLANLRNLAIAETRAATDVLTGLPNKRALDDSFKRMLAHAGRTASPLSVVLLDLDHFKRINDTHGHERGDEALAAVGVLLRSEVRTSDLPGRMGGEEFVILLPDTDRAGAVTLAEKIRGSLHGLKVRNLSGPLTASFGVATFPDDAVEGETLMRIADRAQYAAKQAGRDRAEVPSSRAPDLRPRRYRAPCE